MTQRIKVGDVFITLPEGKETPLPYSPGHDQLKAEKPDDPEPLEEPQYIYRPNDPFRAVIDEAHATASISSSHKPWVKTAWFLIFVVGPLAYAELAALASAIQDHTSSPVTVFLRHNALILPLWLLYFSIWRRKVKG